MNHKILTLAAMLAVPMAIQAEESLSPIVVTATRTAQTADETLASVTVIDQETIERQQPVEFTDLLRGVAGVGITQNGPFGKSSGLHLRGTASEHTLLLVDGVRMGSATTGAPSWQYLPPREIERVEIVRGPRTSLYGSDAIGGVVQVFTRKGEGPPSWNAFTGGGSFDTHEYGAGVSGKSERTTYALSGSHFDTDGIDVQDDVDDDDADGYRNTSVSARLSHEFGNGAEVFANSLRSQGTTEFDGFVDRTEFIQQSSNIGMQGPVTDQWWSQLTFAQSRDENDNFANDRFYSQFDTLRDMLDWQNDIALGRHMVTLGADYLTDQVESTSQFDETSRYNWGAYGQLQLNLGRQALSGSLRYDDNETFGGQSTGQLAWGYQMSPLWRTRVSWGTAFRAPDFNDLYYPFEDYGAWGTYQGNADLEPEESETYEVGLRYSTNWRYFDVALFETTIDNLINIQGFPDMRPQNVRQASIKGLEFEGRMQFGMWRTSIAATLLDTEDKATGNELQHRPRTTARLDIDRDLGALDVGLTASAEGRRYNDADNVERIPGYALLDLRAAYRLNSEWTLKTTVKNALDKEYETVNGYNQPGSAVYASIHYQQ